MRVLCIVNKHNYQSYTLSPSSAASSINKASRSSRQACSLIIIPCRLMYHYTYFKMMRKEGEIRRGEIIMHNPSTVSGPLLERVRIN